MSAILKMAAILEKNLNQIGSISDSDEYKAHYTWTKFQNFTGKNNSLSTLIKTMIFVFVVQVTHWFTAPSACEMTAILEMAAILEKKLKFSWVHIRNDRVYGVLHLGNIS